MNAVLEKYKGVEMVSNEPKLREMMNDIVNWSVERQKSIHAQDRLAGSILLYGDDQNHPGLMLEYVSGLLSDDSMSALYKPHPIFATRQALIEARRELIQEIHRKQMVVDGMVAMLDSTRKRAVLLYEMPTKQLIDVLARLDNSGEILQAL